MKLYELTAEYKNILDLIEVDDSEGLKLALEQLDGEIETKVENSVKVINIRFPLPVPEIITKRTRYFTRRVVLEIQSRNSLHT